MTAPRLQGSGITVTIRHRTVLDGVDVTASGGSWLTLTGPAGAGKSVLLQVLAGLRAPDEGTVLLDGEPAWTGPHHREPPGVLRQDYQLLPVLTALETVALPLQARRASRETIAREPQQWLDRLGLAELADRQVSDLSGGQRQRVALAQALTTSTDILLLDEPTAELDAANRDNVLALLRQLVGNGCLLVVVSQDPAILASSDEIKPLTPPDATGG